VNGENQQIRLKHATQIQIHCFLIDSTHSPPYKHSEDIRSIIPTKQYQITLLIHGKNPINAEFGGGPYCSKTNELCLGGGGA
jgi:hypothetical protein